MISTDSLLSHKEYQAVSCEEGGVGGMNVPLVSDQEGKVSRMYGMYKEGEHIAYRGSFIIDNNRKVATNEKIDLSVGTSMVDQLRQVQAVVGLAEAPNKEYYTPADWQIEDEVEIRNFYV